MQLNQCTTTDLNQILCLYCVCKGLWVHIDLSWEPHYRNIKINILHHVRNKKCTWAICCIAASQKKKLSQIFPVFVSSAERDPSFLKSRNCKYFNLHFLFAWIWLVWVKYHPLFNVKTEDCKVYFICVVLYFLFMHLCVNGSK